MPSDTVISRAPLQAASETHSKSSSLTRRRWTAGMAIVPLAARISLSAQATSTAPPLGVPVPPKVASNPEQQLQKAYADIREVSGRLSKIEVPMNVEPAFSFRP